MATIGNNYTESVEPVFLTQSKELAYYWAQQTIQVNAASLFWGWRTPYRSVTPNWCAMCQSKAWCWRNSPLMMSVKEHHGSF